MGAMIFAEGRVWAGYIRSFPNGATGRGYQQRSQDCRISMGEVAIDRPDRQRVRDPLVR